MPAKRLAPNMREIARQLGVSSSTVSRVLNGYTEGFSVRPDVRERILDLVKTSGYKPNPFVRSVWAKKSMLVAFLDYKQKWEGTSGTYEYAMVTMSNQLAREGYQVSTNLMTEEEPEQYLPQWPVDGIAIPDVAHPARLTRIEKIGIPYVVINGVCGPHGSCVIVDEPQCCNLLFSHLYELGHRRIAYYNAQGTTIKSRSHYSVAQRHAAYLGFLKQHRLKPLTGHDDYTLTPAAFLQLAVRDKHATAIVVYGHFQALKLMRAAYDLGIAIPTQVGLACFDDVYPMQFLNPPVTCVALPTEAMGQLAAELLLRQMRNGQPAHGETHVLQGSLTVRDSVLPVARMGGNVKRDA